MHSYQKPSELGTECGFCVFQQLDCGYVWYKTEKHSKRNWILDSNQFPDWALRRISLHDSIVYTTPPTNLQSRHYMYIWAGCYRKAEDSLSYISQPRVRCWNCICLNDSLGINPVSILQLSVEYLLQQPYQIPNGLRTENCMNAESIFYKHKAGNARYNLLPRQHIRMLLISLFYSDVV